MRPSPSSCACFADARSISRPSTASRGSRSSSAASRPVVSPLPPAPGLSCVSASTTGAPGSPRCARARPLRPASYRSSANSGSASCTACASASTARCTRAGVGSVAEHRHLALGKVGHRKARRERQHRVVLALEPLEQLVQAPAGLDERRLRRQAGQEVERTHRLGERPAGRERAHREASPRARRSPPCRCADTCDTRRGRRACSIIARVTFACRSRLATIGTRAPTMRAHAREDLAFAVVEMLGDHRAVQVEVDAVDGARLRAGALASRRRCARTRRASRAPRATPRPTRGPACGARPRAARRTRRSAGMLAPASRGAIASPKRERRPAAALLERGVVRLRRRERVGLVLETADRNDRHALPCSDRDEQRVERSTTRRRGIRAWPTRSGNGTRPRWRQAIRERGRSPRAKPSRACVARMHAVNPRLNAVTVRPVGEALALADRADEAVARATRTHEPLGPLHGVPVTIKENVDQEGCATVNGVAAFRDVIAPADSPVVANWKTRGRRRSSAAPTRRRSASASTPSTTFAAARYSPWSRAHTPGGSSGGASASVAAGITPLAHGNDIAGSVRYPAYCTGLAGLRPSFGRVPAYNPTAKAERPISAQLMSVQGAARALRCATCGWASRRWREPTRAIRGGRRCRSPDPRSTGPIRVAIVDAAEDLGGIALSPAVAAALRRGRAGAGRRGLRGRRREDAGLRARVRAVVRDAVPEFRRFMHADFERDGDDGIRTAMRYVLDNVPETDARRAPAGARRAHARRSANGTCSSRARRSC